MSLAVEQKRETSIRRRRLLSTIFVLAGLLAMAAPARPAGAQEEATVRVIEVSGLIDPVNVDFTRRALADARREGAAVLVVRIDSPGSVVPEADLRRLVADIESSPVPVAMWIGPGRQSRVVGGAYQLFRAAAVGGMAPGARAASFRPAEAIERGVAQIEAPTLGDFIIGVIGRPLEGGGRIEVPTTVVQREGSPPQVQLAPGARASFAEPSLVAQLLHAVATPSAAYVLLVVGLLLVVFEFFTAGVGVAGVSGAACLVLSAYGLGVLPTRPVALVAVVAGVLGFSIDVQAGAPRVWTVAGTLAFVAGSLTLVAGLPVPVPVVALGAAGVALFMVAGMPAMVRARFSTPTIGRESMLGESGTASSDIDPDGVVVVRDAPWRARTNRATPIRAGDPIVVGGIDGLVLEVEPTQGAARDAGH